jgi:ESS family glutamate:Na+ symporter
VLVALAVIVGMGLKLLVIQLGRFVYSGDQILYLDNLPLFLFTLLGGFLLRWGMRLVGVDDLIDTASIKRIVAVAMEFLIVAAIASLRVEVVASYAGPLALLLGLGFIWTALCLLLSRHILPGDHWFELGILNYGMSTGTTAQGLMLLRIVDRDLESGAAEEYALAAPFSAPFIGGGLLTLSLPLILKQLGMPLVIGLLAGAGLILYVLGRMLRGPLTDLEGRKNTI